MKTIETVTGKVSAGDLGQVLIHEHFTWGTSGWEGDPKAIGREYIVKRCLEEVEAVKKYGVKTIVNATTGDADRCEEILKEIAEKAEVNIILVAGYYAWGGGKSGYFDTLRMYDPENAEKVAYEMISKEIEEGIGNTGIKPGLLKISYNSPDISEYDQMFLEVCARVSLETGTKIITHSSGSKTGADQAKRLLAKGVSPKDIMIGHLNTECTDMSDILAIAEQGVYMGFDRMGMQYYLGTPDNQIQNANLLGMIGMGYSNKIMLSQDHTVCWMGRPFSFTSEINEKLTYWRWTYIHEHLFPFLREHGVSEKVLSDFMINTPAAFLCDKE